MVLQVHCLKEAQGLCSYAHDMILWEQYTWNAVLIMKGFMEHDT